jgi:hypothetical protein
MCCGPTRYRGGGRGARVHRQETRYYLTSVGAGRDPGPQPILYLALFGPLLKGLPGASLGGGGNAYRFFVPGLWLGSRVFVQENA